MPTVSVIIPSYNGARFVGKAIDSVLAQTYRDFELIVVDDGSTDNTPDVLRPFMGKLRYIYQPNRGLAGARNTGIRESTGPYIAFLDADDYWTPDKLEQQMPLFSDPEVGLVYSDLRTVSEDGTVLGTYLSTMDHRDGYVFDVLIRASFTSPSSVVVRRECFSEESFDESLCCVEDLDAWLRIARTWKVAGAHRCLGTRLVWDGSLSAQGQRMLEMKIVVLRKALARYHDLSRGTLRLAHQEVARCAWELGYLHFTQQRMREARKWYLTALREDPLAWQAIPYAAATWLPNPIISRVRWLKGLLRA